MPGVKFLRAVVTLAAILAPAMSPAASEAAVASSVRAAAQADDGTPSIQSWALAPSGADPGEPSSRPNLSYETAPGAEIQDSVTLWNYGNTQLTFRIYATDAFN